MTVVEKIKKWLEDEIKELEHDYGEKLFEPEYSEEHDALVIWDTYKEVLRYIDTITKEIDLSTFVKAGNNRQEAYDDFVKFELGFDEDTRNNLTYEEFCAELDKGYDNSDCIQVARLYEDDNGTIWYDNEYVR